MDALNILSSQPLQPLYIFITQTTPTIIKFAVFMALSQQALSRLGKQLHCHICGPYKVREEFSQPVCAKEETTWCANHIPSTTELTHGHALSAWWRSRPLPPVLPFLLQRTLQEHQDMVYTRQSAGADLEMLKRGCWYCAGLQEAILYWDRHCGRQCIEAHSANPSLQSTEKFFSPSLHYSLIWIGSRTTFVLCTHC